MVGVEFDLWFERVDAAVFEPLVAPFFKIELLAHASVVFGIVCLLQGADEVRELRILPLVFLEVVVERFLHSVLTKHFISLLQEGGALAI